LNWGSRFYFYVELEPRIMFFFFLKKKFKWLKSKGSVVFHQFWSKFVRAWLGTGYDFRTKIETGIFCWKNQIWNWILGSIYRSNQNHRSKLFLRIETTVLHKSRELVLRKEKKKKKKKKRPMVNLHPPVQQDEWYVDRKHFFIIFMSQS